MQSDVIGQVFGGGRMAFQGGAVGVEQVQVVSVQLQLDPIAHLPFGVDLATADQGFVLTRFEVYIGFATQVFDPGHDDTAGALSRFERQVLRANPQAQLRVCRQVRAVEGQGSHARYWGVDQAWFCLGHAGAPA